MTATLHIGDVRDRLAELPDHSVDLVVTSPPFLALRSYLPSDHPDKGKEIGSELTPAAFIDTLLALTDEWRRVLTPYGSICVELGDTYAGSAAKGMDYDDERQARGEAPKFRQARVSPDYRLAPGAKTQSSGGGEVLISGGPGWPLDKCLTGIPHLYNLSLAYGYNLLNPEHRIDRWRIRNYLTWCRPNPPVGALGDKFRPATSFVTVATMGRDRWFDLDAVRTVNAPERMNRSDSGSGYAPGEFALGSGRGNGSQNPAGAPPLDWDAPDNWEERQAALIDEAIDNALAAFWQPLVDLPTQPYGGAHYATFPMELPRRLIEAMCPRSVCVTCGEPRRRITAPTADYDAERCGGDFFGKGNARDQGLQGKRLNGRPNAAYDTLGWTDCGHDTWRPGIVLDPFAGSGTTLAAATGCGRDAIGIDLDDRNVDLCRERVGMFLEVAA